MLKYRQSIPEQKREMASCWVNSLQRRRKKKSLLHRQLPPMAGSVKLAARPIPIPNRTVRAAANPGIRTVESGGMQPQSHSLIKQAYSIYLSGRRSPRRYFSWDLVIINSLIVAILRAHFTWTYIICNGQQMLPDSSRRLQKI